MKAAIITIGDEILIGQTVDTNSAWLGKKISELGIELRQTLSISDQHDEIIRALDASLELSDLVIITGGLGPTNDDITKKTLVAYFETELVQDKQVLERMEDYFKSRKLQILDVHREQAMLPQNALKLINHRGSASGMWFEKKGKIVISLPGVPYEAKGIMRDYGFDKIKDHFNLPFRYHRTILTWGRGESFIANKIEKWEMECKEKDLSVAYLPSPGLVKIRVSSGSGNSAVKNRVDEQIEKLYQLIPKYIYGENSDLLEEQLGNALRSKGKTVATAESCTGGYAAHLLTSIPGSSDYFKGSVVAYSNEIKENVLNISPNDLERFGAVSEEVVRQMAENVRDIMKSDYGIASSGIAGPDPESEDLPAGTIWIAIASESGVNTKLLHFGNRRLYNIKVASIACLGRLLKEIQV